VRLDKGERYSMMKKASSPEHGKLRDAADVGVKKNLLQIESESNNNNICLLLWSVAKIFVSQINPPMAKKKVSVTS
jgi:hypothetical protein